MSDKCTNCVYLERIKILEKALSKIAKWSLPDTGKFVDEEKTRPASYDFLHGSNGERDYMRNIARMALNSCLKPGDKVLVSYDGMRWFGRYFVKIRNDGNYVATRAVEDDFTGFPGAALTAYKYCKPYKKDK